jgi:hypothetical protein
VVKCDPTAVPPNLRNTHQKVRFYKVSLNDIGAYAFDQLAQRTEYLRIKREALVETMHLQTGRLRRGEKLIRFIIDREMIPPYEDGNDNLDTRTRLQTPRHTAEFKQVLGGTSYGRAFEKD